MKEGGHFLFILFMFFQGTMCNSNNEDLTNDQLKGGQIIADHTVIDLYDDIPQQWIDSVKKMHIYIPGTSHALAFAEGCKLLEEMDPRYQVNVYYEENYSDDYLRFSHTWVRPSPGYAVEEDIWYIWKAWPEGTEPGEADSIKNMIKRNYDHGHPIDAIGFGWCVDMMSSYIGGRDPVYKCRWMGPAVGSPDFGHKGWGLDADDYSLTSNRVCLDTYLNANLDYQAYCDANGYPTKVIYTTGVADSVIYYGEPSYQRYVKNEYMRNFVKADPNRILLDYEDIVCYDDGSSERNEAIWTYDGVNYSYPYITTRNAGDYSKGHIGPAGALRLGKAIWWMMARIAGWDGSSK